METSKKEQFELKQEQKEVKEKEVDKELLAAAALERADILVEATKTGAQQMQNIAQNIAQVKNTIAQIRATLGLSDDTTTDPSSVEQDKNQLAKLHKRILDYKSELVILKKEEIKKQNPALTESELQQAAEQAVNLLLEKTNT